jgi:hypothetical protein
MRAFKVEHIATIYSGWWRVDDVEPQAAAKGVIDENP